MKSLTDSSIGHTKNVKIQLIERDCGIVLPYKKRHGNVLTFYRTDFPELWEND